MGSLITTHWRRPPSLAIAAGMIASALAGFAAISWLLRYLQRSSTLVFVLYRFGLGIFLLSLVLAGFR